MGSLLDAFWMVVRMAAALDAFTKRIRGWIGPQWYVEQQAIQIRGEAKMRFCAVEDEVVDSVK